MKVLHTIEGRALIRSMQYDNGCRWKCGNFHRSGKIVEKKPCPEICGCVLEAQAMLDEQVRAEAALDPPAKE